MLNTKYFIQGGQAQRNQNAYGNAWFVNSYDVVANADAEMDALATLKPAEKAVIQVLLPLALSHLTLLPILG